MQRNPDRFALGLRLFQLSEKNPSHCRILEKKPKRPRIPREKSFYRCRCRIVRLKYLMSFVISYLFTKTVISFHSQDVSWHQTLAGAIRIDQSRFRGIAPAYKLGSHLQVPLSRAHST